MEIVGKIVRDKRGATLLSYSDLIFLSNQIGIWYTTVFWSNFFEYANRNCVSISVFFLKFILKNIFFRGIWELVSRLLIELQSSSKNQKNPHDQLSGVGDTFQSSSYHSFPLKPGRVKNTPSPNKNSVSQFPVSFWAI